MKNYRNSFPDYGYRVDISDGKIRKLYSRYKRWKGIPEWCPLSDNERLEFEKYILGEKKVKINPNDSLCWFCANAVPSVEKKTGCPWSIWREDVPGWEIIETVRKIKYNHQEIKKTGKIVIKCPMFKRG